MLFKYISVFFFIFFNQNTSAQLHNYSIQQYNSESGMQNSIKGMQVDKKGYLWLATEMGLERYDGNQFKVYNKTNLPGVKIDRLIHIGLTKDSNIYVQSADSNFYYLGSNGILHLTSPNTIFKNSADIGNINFSVYKIYAICKLKYENKLIPGWAVPDFNLISRSAINSIVYKNGYYYYFNENKEFIAADLKFSSFKKLIFTGEIFKQLHQHIPVSLIQQENEIYLRCGEKIYQLIFSNKQNAVLANLVLQVNNISNISCFLKLPDYDISFVGTMSDGLYVFKKQNFSTLLLKDPEANVFYAQAPYEDSGVLTKKAVLFQGKSTILPAKFTSESILKTREGNYYLNKMEDEENCGIVELNSQLKEISNISAKNLRVHCFQQLQDGSVWLSANDEFLGKIENHHIIWIKPPPTLPAGFIVSTFLEAGKNEFWIAGAKGLAKINLVNNAVKIIPGLSNVNVRSLYIDKQHTIWIGTYGKGYYALYKERLVALPSDQNNYLAATHAFIEDKKGFMWITTNHGLFQVSVKNLYNYLDGYDRLVYYYYYDHTAGFPTNEFDGGCVPAAIELKNGMFSFPSLKGLVQFYPDSIQPLLPTSEIYVDAVLTDTNYINPANKIEVLHNINHIQFFISSPYFGNSYNQSIEYKLKGISNAWYTVNDGGYIEFNQLRGGNYTLLLRKRTGFSSKNYITKEVPYFIQPAIYDTWFFRILLAGILGALIYFIYRFRMYYLLRQKNKLQREVYERTKEQNALINTLEQVILELEQSQESLYQTVLFKEKLALILSHDIQSPLRFLSDAAQRLYEKSLQYSFTEITEVAKELKTTSGNIHHFVKDFNSWLNSMDKNFSVQNNRINVYELLNEISVFFTELLKIKGNKIIVEADPSAAIYTDYQLLKIILRNIIDNANKHTFQGTIYIRCYTKNNGALISITDTGRGIDADTLVKLKKRIKNNLRDDYKEKEIGFGYRFIIDFCKLLIIHLNIESNPETGTAVSLKNLKYNQTIISKTSIPS